MITIKRICLRFRYPFLRLYWLVFRPQTSGVKVVITDGGNEVLLVRRSYGGGGWTFPGGRVESGEMPERTVKRELKEELGLDISSSTFISEIKIDQEFKKDQLFVFRAVINRQQPILIDQVELVEFGWFRCDQTPILPSVSSKVWQEYLAYIKTKKDD